MKRNRKKAIVYGAKGFVRLEVQQEHFDELPFEYVGSYTGVPKLWTKRRRTLFIDVRDLPGLSDKRYLFGLEEKSEKKTKQRKKEQKEEEQEPIIIQEVKDVNS